MRPGEQPNPMKGDGPDDPPISFAEGTNPGSSGEPLRVWLSTVPRTVLPQRVVVVPERLVTSIPELAPEWHRNAGRVAARPVDHLLGDLPIHHFVIELATGRNRTAS